MTSKTPNESIPPGTRVINTDDGEPGTILGAFAWNRTTGEWTEYEVETGDAIEIWPRKSILRLDEAEAAARDDGGIQPHPPETATMDANDPTRDTTVREIAKRELLIETLDRRMRDALDFHEVSVWGVEAALEAAYEAGRDAGRRAERRRRTPTRCQCPAFGREIRITPVT